MQSHSAQLLPTYEWKIDRRAAGDISGTVQRTTACRKHTFYDQHAHYGCFTELMDAKVVLYCLALICQALLTECYWHWHIKTVGWMCKHVMLPCIYHQAQCKSNIIIIIEREAKISNYSYQLAKEGVTAVLIE